jgi:radical SAM protein with 4Fe4S-binding SPASM domain
VRKNLPLSHIELVTNGDVLNAARLRRLFDSGLSTLLISVYDSQEDADQLEDLCRNTGLESEQYVIRHRYLPPEDDFGITLSNRAGMMQGTEHAIAALTEPLKAPCNYPHYTFFMDYLGDVLLCPHDWGKKKIVGNMNDSDFLNIWNTPQMTALRNRLASGDRCFQPCAECDVKGMLMGNQHVKAWNDYYGSKK